MRTWAGGSCWPLSADEVYRVALPCRPLCSPLQSQVIHATAEGQPQPAHLLRPTLVLDTFLLKRTTYRPGMTVPAAGAPNSGVADARGALAAGLLGGLTASATPAAGLGPCGGLGPLICPLTALQLVLPPAEPVLHPGLLSLLPGLLPLLRPGPVLLSPALLASGP